MTQMMRKTAENWYAHRY